MSVQEADMLSSLPIPKRQNSEPEKHLFVCFMSVEIPAKPLLYTVKSIPLSSLSGSSSSEHDIQLKDVVVWSDSTIPYAMGFVRTRDLLYGVGGAILDEKLSYLLNQDFLVRELRFTHLPPGGNSYLHRKTTSSMRWGKHFPIVVEIGDLIYALSQPPFLDSGLRDRVFEVYDPSKDEWTSLDGPPFLDTDTAYYMPYSYVVIGKKLCVSTRGASCAFDTENRTWGACDLFSDYYGSDDLSSEESYGSDDPSSEERYNIMRLLPLEECPDQIGFPFPFVRNAIFYEDFLLCNVPYSKPPVVAFKILNGKVVRKLPLLDNGIQRGPNTNFVDLGGGEFCLVCQRRRWDDGSVELTVVKFKVRKGEDGGLGCADVTESTFKFSTAPVCMSTYAFAL